MKGFLLLAGLAVLASNVQSTLDGGIIKAGEGFFDMGRKNAEAFQEVVGVPTKPEEVTFALFTSDHKNEYINITHDDYKQLVNKEGRTYFIVHGWNEHRNVPWYHDLKEALLKKEPKAFVVEVDWKAPAHQEYSFSAYNTEDVGRMIGTLIHNVNTKYDVPLDHFVIIGHSLGGQVGGWAGKRVKLLSQGKKIGRIIALDPAGPLFNLRVETRRLNRNDAKVVHILHTDGNKCGFTLPCGTIDFFPNGGMDQAGCAKVDLSAGIVATVWDPAYCDHGRSYEYIIEAINNADSFKSIRCGDYFKFQANICDELVVSMGDMYTEKEGNFFLTTNTQKPYSKPLEKQHSFRFGF